MANYFIRSNHGTAIIKVEEYKRPNFEVKIDPLKEEYILNKTININGLC